MDKRIKIVWYLSIVTILLIFGGQIYWLYNQYLYSSEGYNKQLYDDCKALVEQERNIRIHESRKDTKFKLPTISMQLSISMQDDEKGPHANGTFSIYRNNIKRVTKINNITSEEASIMINRCTSDRYQQFRSKTMDSLLTSKSYEKASNYRFYNSKKLFIYPSYHKINHYTVHVEYSYNPLEYQTVSFDIRTPIKPILLSMAWQLAGSILLLFVLTFCLLYQIRTIIFQKRIDSLRHEFMKNMIYEMKQPPADDNITDEAIHIGNMEFFYSLNELHCGTERVIITSRQAEILKLLADSPNEVVPRETILKHVWGDDSYANSLALNVQITYLRRALKSDKKLCIEAIMKKGYVLKITD